ncbi:MAG TPA: hypothetical protein PK957_04920 [Candidatus Dojkabacteria bacterium]|nr:hypothetical protein [Candidatus Dojkabacteria bacterium]
MVGWTLQGSSQFLFGNSLAKLGRLWYTGFVGEEIQKLTIKEFKL